MHDTVAFSLVVIERILIALSLFCVKFDFCIDQIKLVGDFVAFLFKLSSAFINEALNVQFDILKLHLGN